MKGRKQQARGKETMGSMEIEGRDREGKEGDEEEVLKVGESRIRNVIIKDENVIGGELTEKKGWCRTPVERRRNGYRAGAGSIRRPAVRGARRASTQARVTNDVIGQIDGHLARGRQSSARRLARLRRNHRGLAAFAS